MRLCPGQVILAAGDGEDTLWMSLLVLMIVVTAWAVYGVVKTRVGGFKGKSGYYGRYGRGRSRRERLLRAIRQGKEKWLDGLVERVKERTFSRLAGSGSTASEGAGDKKEMKWGKVGRDLGGGTELLGREFLVGVIEDTDGSDERDVSMRRMSFEELVRRGELGRSSSEALKVYAVDEGHLYGKVIQCEALEELARRTGGGGEEQSRAEAAASGGDG